MRILLASSEVHPYSKTGGLADMTGALGKALACGGHQAGIITPLFRGIRERFPQIRRVGWHFDLPLGGKRVDAELWVLEPAKRLKIYFIHKPEYFDRAGLYNENGEDYWDNGERFVFFSKCVAHLARYLPWQPQVVHVHDWQAGLVPLLIQHQRQQAGWGSAPRTCMTIHNLAYQGVFPGAAYALTNLPPDYFHAGCCEDYGRLNCLKAGIASADCITTVSPRYAREILTGAFGEGLDSLLRQRQAQLRGILNGVDYDEWRTKDNRHLFASYAAGNLRGKGVNKRALLKQLALPVLPRTPLFGSVTRLAEQKGLDILLPALHEMLHTSIQFVILGSGTDGHARALRELQNRFPDRVAVRFGFDETLSHRIEAASDFYLMPSRFEPCGLNQMYSLRYGTIPVVRATGGLDDSIVDATQVTTRATGIKFHDYSASALATGIRKALALYDQPALLRQYQRNAMRADFSWAKTASQYAEVYARAL
jgi:starch synthase